MVTYTKTTRRCQIKAFQTRANIHTGPTDVRQEWEETQPRSPNTPTAPLSAAIPYSTKKQTVLKQSVLIPVQKYYEN